MKITEFFYNTVKQTISFFIRTAQNCIHSAADRLAMIFRKNKKPDPRLLLPAGTQNLLENRTGKDFYTGPVRICRKSLQKVSQSF